MKVSLDNYTEYQSNSNAWKSYVRSEGTAVLTYEPMNCRELRHKSRESAILFLQTEGYLFKASFREEMPEMPEGLEHFIEN